MNENAMTTAFISYSWDSENHREWVRELATRLRSDGVDVSLDQWDAVPGDQLPQFMEKSIRENDYVLLVCTPNYKSKSDQRKGGVGYEGDIITGELFTKGNQRKFIPILRGSNWEGCAPSWVAGKLYVSMNTCPISESSYEDLFATMTNSSVAKPPLGPRRKARRNSVDVDTSKAEFEPIKIVGVLIDEASEPKRDGSRGSALYSIPLQLSASPSSDWCKVFASTWDHPPSYTTSHRPGIARVSGDRIILDGTTIEELRDYHRDTLRIVVESTNTVVGEHERKMRAIEQKRQQQSQQHRDNLRDIGDSIEF